MPPEAVCSSFLRAASVSREDLYGVPVDGQMPLHLHDDARVPFLGFAGQRYVKGSVVLLAINPGGGGDAYQMRTTQDAQLLPLIEAFRRSSPSDTADRFDAMSRNYALQVRSWNLWRILGPVLEACGKELEEIAYLNCFPYRTTGDRKPSSQALRASWAKIVEPLLSELQPSKVVALGMKAGGVAETYHRGSYTLYVVPRTIGDSRISSEAQLVLKALRENAP